MNAAIRSVVRVACDRGWTVLGFRRGFTGLIEGDFVELAPRAVANILQHGGTVLKTARSEEYRTEAGQESARAVLESHGVSGLVTIGGDGTFRGAHEPARIYRGSVVGVPATIDNDVFGSDETIGFDTAINTALDAIDRIRDTASSHERIFLVEVMGRHWDSSRSRSAPPAGPRRSSSPKCRPTSTSAARGWSRRTAGARR